MKQQHKHIALGSVHVTWTGTGLPSPEQMNAFAQMALQIKNNAKSHKSK
jgi:hypothetical protein